MTLPITIPNQFANATVSIPLSQLDNNFTVVANAVNGMGNGTVALANVNITGGSANNVTITSLTTPLTAAQGGTGLSNVGTSGNVLTSNGTAWLSQLGGVSATANLVTITYNMANATGTQVITGVGFQPRFIFFLGAAVLSGSVTNFTSIGAADTARNAMLLTSGLSGNGTHQILLNTAIRLFTDTTTGNIVTATVASYDADGFTLSWTKTGTPTGNAAIGAFCLR